MSVYRRSGESDPEDQNMEEAALASDDLPGMELKVPADGKPEDAPLDGEASDSADGQVAELEPIADFEVISNRTNMQDQTTDRLDADELAAGWAEFEDRRPEKHAVLAFGAKTDLGSVRENNEDKYDLLEPQQPGILATKGRFYGVADGMGGHSAGQIASELALKTVIYTYYREPSDDVIQSLRTAVSEANALIFDTAQLIPERQGMGTTLTIAVVLEDQLIVANVGDSRTYLIRDGKAKQITNDHSWVAEQVRLGTMTLEEASLSPLRNVITRSIGTSPSVEPDFYHETLREGDYILLCSDGLTGHIDPEEIAERLNRDVSKSVGPSVAAMRLVELANARGGRDNISVIILAIRAIVPFEQCAFGM